MLFSPFGSKTEYRPEEEAGSSRHQGRHDDSDWQQVSYQQEKEKRRADMDLDDDSQSVRSIHAE
jgi:hypothetical protein